MSRLIDVRVGSPRIIGQSWDRNSIDPFGITDVVNHSIPGQFTEPTVTNRGPQVGSFTDISSTDFMNTPGTYNGYRINGGVNWPGQWAGQWDCTDCVFPDTMFFNCGPDVVFNSTRCSYPGWIMNVWPSAPGATLFMDSCYVDNGVQIAQVDSSGNLFWPNPGATISVTLVANCFHRNQGSDVDHTEAVHTLGWMRGYDMRGNSFIQRGPFNGTATGSVNLHSLDCVYDNNWHRWENGVAATANVYLEGAGNICSNGFIEGGAAYINGASNPHATYINMRDYDTNELLVLP